MVELELIIAGVAVSFGRMVTLLDMCSSIDEDDEVLELRNVAGAKVFVEVVVLVLAMVAEMTGSVRS